MKFYRKYILFLIALLVLIPLGLVLPHYFKAGEAWGEWSVQQVKEQTGIAPKGMKKDAELYKAPISDYNLSNDSASLSERSVHYIISGLIGTGIILILTFGINKLLARKKE